MLKKMEGNSRPGGIFVVGLKLSPESREMLTWIVAKLTRPGDHVIAVHVLQASSNAVSRDNDLDPTVKQELDKTFEGVLGVYEGLCTLKQIKLDIKVVSGTGVREGLVEAARMEEATKLILGNKKHLMVSWSSSLARYCLKRLPSSCSLIVIEQGKIVLDKPGTCSISASSNIACAPNVLQRGIRKLGQKTCTIAAPDSLKVAHSSESPLSSETRNCLQMVDSCMSAESTTVSICAKDYPDSPISVLPPSTEAISYESFKWCVSQRPSPLSSQDVLPNSGASPCSNTHWGDLNRRPQQSNCSTSQNGDNAVGDSTASSRCDMQQDCGSSEPEREKDPPGWPLMHRSISLQKLSQRNLPVVKWAMQLPDRSKDQESENVETFNCRADDNSSAELLDTESISCVEHDGRQKPAQESLLDRLNALCSKKTAVRFLSKELEKATSHFAPGNLVGNGGCSEVYRGTLVNGQTVAVKCFTQRGPDAEKELLTEVEILTTIRHRNIVCLLGYCAEEDKHMLVYNFAHNGSLEQRLRDCKDSRPLLDWSARYRIAIGAARALEYLHDGCPKPVVHMDIKTSNILLSDKLEPLVADFGLAKWAPTSSTFITCTDVVGTFGYLAPEYFMFGRFNEKTDVYSFGVVLLELITGKQPIDVSNPKGQQNLVIWGRPLVEDGKLEDLIDPRLNGKWDPLQVKHMVYAAALCLRSSAQLRPRMRRVLKILCGDEEIMLGWPKRELIMEEEGNEEEYNGNQETCDVRSHLALAMVGVNDDVLSQCSADESSFDFTNSSKTLEDYLGGRYSRSSSLES